MLIVYIGYDSREPEAFEVARYSIIKHASVPVNIVKLDQQALRRAGLFKRTEAMIHGQRYDMIDGKPFSTEFSFTRFLVPALMQWTGWALFMDCDQLFRKDIAELEKELDDKYAVMVCQQNYLPKTDTKMDGQKQEKYFRKNWSSVMAFNCGHPENLNLTVDAVNMEPGSWLHGLQWLPDELIGNIDHRWNWIDGTTEGEPFNVHYTLGGPWFSHMRYSNAPYFEEWRQAARELGLWEKLEAAA